MLSLSFILTKQGEKMTLYFGYLQKDKKIPLVPKDCLLLNKYISFTSAQAFFIMERFKVNISDKIIHR